MWSVEAMNEVVSRSDYSISELAERMNVPTTWFYNHLRKDTTKSMVLRTMQTLLDACDYKIVVMPKRQKTPKNGIEIREDA